MSVACLEIGSYVRFVPPRHRCIRHQLNGLTSLRGVIVDFHTDAQAGQNNTATIFDGTEYIEQVSIFSIESDAEMEFMEPAVGDWVEYSDPDDSVQRRTGTIQSFEDHGFVAVIDSGGEQHSVSVYELVFLKELTP